MFYFFIKHNERGAEQLVVYDSEEVNLQVVLELKCRKGRSLDEA